MWAPVFLRSEYHVGLLTRLPLYVAYFEVAQSKLVGHCETVAGRELKGGEKRDDTGRVGYLGKTGILQFFNVHSHHQQLHPPIYHRQHHKQRLHFFLHLYHQHYDPHFTSEGRLHCSLNKSGQQLKRLGILGNGNNVKIAHTKRGRIFLIIRL